jgi:SAM-dependent methyltransferase
VTDVFDREATSYDAWYDTASGRSVFADELDALRPLLSNLTHPWLEVGVGTGRFAAALGAEFGVDPSRPSLAFAARRQIHVAVARGEALPFPPRAFGAVLIVTTLCFVDDPLAVLREARRVLQPEGKIVLGVVPADGLWGRHYQTLAAGGHAYYRPAHFFRRAELAALARAAGLEARRTRSALSWAPQGEPRTGTAREGDDPIAGFIAVLLAPRPELTLSDASG